MQRQQRGQFDRPSQGHAEGLLIGVTTAIAGRSERRNIAQLWRFYAHGRREKEAKCALSMTKLRWLAQRPALRPRRPPAAADAPEGRTPLPAKSALPAFADAHCWLLGPGRLTVRLQTSRDKVLARRRHGKQSERWRKAITRQ